MILIQPQDITIVSSSILDTETFDDSAGVHDDSVGVFDDAYESSGLTGNYMFDLYLNTQSEAANQIEVEISFNNCDRVALFNMDAVEVELELTDNDTASVVQTKTIDLSLGGGKYQQWIVESLYVYADATLKITISNPGSTAKCGMCAIGLSADIGQTLYGARSGYVDYSIKSTNDFGYTYLSPGNWAKAPQIQTQIDRENVDAVYEDLVNARGSFVVLDANEGETDFETFRIYGFLEDWRIAMDNPTKANVNLTIRGAI